MKSLEPLYLTRPLEDPAAEVVPHGDPRAAFVLVGAGCELETALARRFGLLSEDPAPAPAPEPEIHVPQGHVDPTVPSFAARVRAALQELCLEESVRLELASWLAPSEVEPMPSEAKALPGPAETRHVPAPALGYVSGPQARKGGAGAGAPSVPKPAGK